MDFIFRIVLISLISLLVSSTFYDFAFCTNPSRYQDTMFHKSCQLTVPLHHFPII